MTWELQRLLRGPQAGDVLASAMASAGLVLDSWSLDRIYTRPLGDADFPEVSARFQVLARGREMTLVVSTRSLEPGQLDALGAVRADSNAGRLHVWAHPTDPELPGLAVVEDLDLLGRRLAPLLEVPVQVTAITLLVLRPLRRAVYRVQVSSSLGQRTLFIKVVRPAKITQLLKRYAACSLAPSAADAGDGLMVLEAASGQAVTKLLYRPTSPRPGLPINPHTVLSALESLRFEALDLPARQPPAARHRSFVRPLVAAGAEANRLQRLSDSIAARLLETPGPVVPTHGDFHPSNLFLTDDGAHPSAVIDADTVGPGFRADDLATFFAHLVALPSFDKTGYADVPGFIDALWQNLRHDDDAADLPARTAACLISLAPGARSPKQLEHYLSTAETLLICDKSHRDSGKFTNL